MILENFVGPSYVSASPNVDAELCMNWYVENVESAGAKVRRALMPCPGFATWSTVAKTNCRGLFTVQIDEPHVNAITTMAFGVFGNGIYVFSPTGVATLCAGPPLTPGNDPVGFATNGTEGMQLLFCAGGSVYCMDLSSGIYVQVLIGLGGLGVAVTQVAFLESFFIALAPAQNSFYISASLDGLTWDLTQIAERSGASDPWTQMVVVHRELWLFGTRTSEVWYNAGTSPFPFAPIQGAALEQGTAARWSVNLTDSAAIWLGQDLNGQWQVVRGNGYAATRISTHAVESSLAGYNATDPVSNAIAFSYQDLGHTFYVLTVPNNPAWVYDCATQLWHQRGAWMGGGAGTFGAYSPVYHTSAFGLQLVADVSGTTTVYTMSVGVATELGSTSVGITRTRRSPHQWDGIQLNRVFFKGLQIDMQTGIGKSFGVIPNVSLRWSDDNTTTWTTAITAPSGAGASGATQVRVLFQPLGSARNRIWELSVSDPVVPWAIVQAVYRPDPEIGLH